MKHVSTFLTKMDKTVVYKKSMSRKADEAETYLL
jgi:hypothetical protein